MNKNQNNRRNRCDRRRQLKPWASYNVTCKVNRDEIIFDTKFSTLFEETIEKCKKKYSFQIHNFTVMGNHTHLMITPGKNASLPKIMQWINSVFAKAYNKATGQSGHVWKERYFSEIIKNAKQFITTFEDIVRNPIKADLIENAKNFPPSGLFHHLHNITTIITEKPVIHKLFEHYKDFHEIS